MRDEIDKLSKTSLEIVPRQVRHPPTNLAHRVPVENPVS